MKRALLILIVSLLATGELAADVASYLQRAPLRGTVVVERTGDRLFTQGDDQVAYQIGSITKVFTAVAILRLQDRGLLNLQDAVTKYLSFPAGEGITLEELLDHNSGIPDYFNEPDDVPSLLAFAQKPHRLDEIVDLIRYRPLHFTPGTEFRYSNSNYLLLGRIVEIVSGMRYEDFLNSEILMPLEMTHTGVARNPEGVTVAEAHADFPMVPEATTFDLSFYASAGGIVSTASDLARFGRALLEGKLLSRTAWQNMTTPRREGYGLGWQVGRMAGGVNGGHSGRTVGYSSLLSVDEKSQTVVVLLSNWDNAVTPELGENIMTIARRQ